MPVLRVDYLDHRLVYRTNVVVQLLLRPLSSCHSLLNGRAQTVHAAECECGARRRQRHLRLQITAFEYLFLLTQRCVGKATEKNPVRAEPMS